MDYLKSFATLGTKFLRPADHLQRQLGNIRAVVFDWDGVFNNGWKDLDGGSPFSEVDSMGLNLLRFSLWQRDQVLPVFAVITGQQNPHAQRFAEREHFENIYMGYSNKADAFAAFLAKHELDARQVAFFFDDVLDLPVARQCGLRIMIKRRSSPLFENFVVAARDADLLTHFSGGEHGLREASELLMALGGRHAETIEHRVKFSETYQAYLADRAARNTEVVRPTVSH